MKKRALIFIILILFSVTLPTILAADFTYVVSNSEKWQDVYSSMLYANLKGVNSDFLVSTNHGPLLLNGINRANFIRVISSKDRPYVFNYPDLIKAKGFTGADELVVDNANIRLLDDLPNIDSFIVVGDSYGFDAIAVSPYAVLTKSWVFLANKINIYGIDSALSKRTIKKILIVGYVDREVRDALAKYNPEIIDNQDRFKDNIEMVKRYEAIKPVKQVALSNGEFIEKELMNGLEPVLFTGRDNVPDQIAAFLKSSDIQIGVLIGNELVGAATNIRRGTGISVMVKFARGARTQTQGVAPIEGLDLFPLPTPTVALSLYTIKYNKMSSQLEVTYKSDSNVPIYFKGTITLVSNGQRIKVGDIDPVFVAPGDYKTTVYSVSIDSTENLSAEIYTLYGDSAASMDRIIQNQTQVEVIQVIDRCKFNPEDIKGLKYNKQKKEFVVTIKNPNEVDCWGNIELRDVVFSYLTRTLSSDKEFLMQSGKTIDVIIKQDLTDDELSKNQNIKFVLYSGEKEDSLVNVLTIDQFPLKIENLTLMTYAIIGLVIVIMVLIIIIIILKRRKDED